MQEDILEEFDYIMTDASPVDILLWCWNARREILRLREYEWMYKDLNK